MTAMKRFFLGIVGAFLCLGSVIWGQERTMGRPLGRSGLSNTRMTCSGAFGPKCADCNTLMTCARTELNSQPCSSINQSTPYCVNNACSSIPSAGCTLPFTCTGSGLYPDPNDCQRYYLCESPGGKSVTYECPENFAYDSRSGLCKRRKTPSDCQTINCSANPNNYVLYMADRSVMGYCQSVGKRKQTILFRCLDSASMEYNMNTLSCEFKCKSDGRFPDKLDCHKFYECYRNSTDFTFHHESCPVGFWYNPGLQMCERRSSCLPEIPENDVIEEGSGGGVAFFY